MRLGHAGVMSPPSLLRNEREFRDRAFNVQLFMLCKIVRFIKSPESSARAFSNQGEKSCIFACVRTVTNFRCRTTERRFVKALIQSGPQKIRASLYWIWLGNPPCQQAWCGSCYVPHQSDHFPIPRMGREVDKGELETVVDVPPERTWTNKLVSRWEMSAKVPLHWSYWYTLYKSSATERYLHVAGAGPYCNYSCNPYSKAKNNKEKTMPRIRKLEQVEKSTKSRKLQKNKTKHNMYQLVEVAYHVST